MQRRWKLASVAATVVVVGVAMAAVAVASGRSELSKPVTLHVTTSGGQFAFLQLNPNKKTLYGDQVVIKAPVFNAGSDRKIGSLHATCTFFDKPGVVSECTITTYLNQGNIVAHGRVDFGKNNHTTGAILGGTGQYRNARGQVIFENSTGNTEGFIFQLEP
jgi:Dirigent-like protein